VANRFQATPIKGFKWMSQLDHKGFWSLIVGRTVTELNDDEVVESLKLGRSFIRWGDGETANLRGKSSWHQSGDTYLSDELARFLDYIRGADHLILGLPFVAIKGSLFNTSIWPLWKIKVLLSTRVLLNSNRIQSIPSSRVADAEIWYRIFLEIPSILLSIGVKYRPVLLVSGNDAHRDAIAAICNADYFEIRSLNAFEQYEEIHQFTFDWATSHIAERPIILLAAGSVGKLLVMHLPTEVQVVDIGSGLSALLEGRIERDWIIHPEKFKL
jgi:hypothetical protein